MPSRQSEPVRGTPENPDPHPDWDRVVIPDDAPECPCGYGTHDGVGWVYYHALDCPANPLSRVLDEPDVQRPDRSSDG